MIAMHPMSAGWLCGGQWHAAAGVPRVPAADERLLAGELWCCRIQILGVLRRQSGRWPVTIVRSQMPSLNIPLACPLDVQHISVAALDGITSGTDVCTVCRGTPGSWHASIQLAVHNRPAALQSHLINRSRGPAGFPVRLHDAMQTSGFVRFPSDGIQGGDMQVRGRGACAAAVAAACEAARAAWLPGCVCNLQTLACPGHERHEVWLQIAVFCVLHSVHPSPPGQLK